MTPEDQYPSTDDCAFTLEKDEDGVVKCLEYAKCRVEVGWTASNYVGLHGVVCAVGALCVANEQIQHGDDGSPDDHPGGISAYLEQELTNEAKCAIELLNEVALKEHPESQHYGSWTGPLEWVNQEWTPPGLTEEFMADEITADEYDEVRKQEIVRLYGLAIERRQRELAPA